MSRLPQDQEVNKYRLLQEEVLPREDLFMALAVLASKSSRHPSKQTGAILVNNKRVASVGYNGLSNNTSNSEKLWENPEAIHSAISNALSNNDASPSGCIVYSTCFPSEEDQKLMEKEGIAIVYHFDPKSKEDIQIVEQILIIHFGSSDLTHRSVNGLQRIVDALNKIKDDQGYTRIGVVMKKNN